jgi:hypothetical protein
MRAVGVLSSLGVAFLSVAFLAAAPSSGASAAAPGTAIRPVPDILPGGPGCTNNLSVQTSPTTVTVRGNMAGCLRANLDITVKGGGEVSGTDCANSTSCSRPAFVITVPSNACTIVVTEVVGMSSKFSGEDVEDKTFGPLPDVQGNVKVFRLRGPDAPAC